MLDSKMIARYYDSLSKVLSGHSELASVTGHPSDTGINREDILRDFINAHTPSKLEAILGGKIIGLEQPASKQIDCMVCSDIAPRFNQNNRSIAIVEAVGVAISVKSHLDKKGIIDSIENLASIPKVSPKVLSETSSINRNLVSRFSEIAPIRVCFAYTGINPETIMGHMIEYYNDHKEIAPNQRIKAVIVNGESVIKFDPNGMEIEGGMKIKPYEYYWTTIKDRPGIGLAEVVSHLASISTWYNQLQVTFSHYLNEAYIEQKESVTLTPYKPKENDE
jgi:hypothetical protein